MGSNLSSKTRKAIKLVESGQMTRYQAAKQCRIAMSTIYRAMPQAPVRLLPPEPATAHLTVKTYGRSTGCFVDKEAAELGLVRTAGESDESLRARIAMLKKLHGLS